MNVDHGKKNAGLKSIDQEKKAEIREMLEPCTVHADTDEDGKTEPVKKWCWKQDVMFLNAKKNAEEAGQTFIPQKHFLPMYQRPLLDKVTNCGSRGTRISMTMCFVAGITANLLLVLAMSTERTVCE